MVHFCFCFPYRGVGGVPLLFLRLAESLARRGCSVSLIDYPDGAMAAHCPPSVELIEYSDEGRVVPPAGATLVFQAMTPWSIFPGLRPADATSVLFWNCHPFNLVPTLPGLRRRMQASPVVGRAILATALRPYLLRMRRFVRLLTEKGSLVFMDLPNVENTKRYLGMELASPVLLPIPVPSRFAAARRPPDIAAHGLRLAWVGRLVDFKVSVLKHALSRLDRLQPSLHVPMTMVVVGSGEYAEELSQYAAKLDNIEVMLVDHVAHEKLDAFLIDGVDVLFAMGTAALEGAKLGIPTILLDVAYGPVPDGYVFRWLDQSRGYSLGDVLSDEHLIPGNQSLAECFAEVLSGYGGLSGRMINYFNRHHSLEAVADRFVGIAASASCTWGDIAERGLAKRGALYSLFDSLRKLTRK